MQAQQINREYNNFIHDRRRHTRYPVEDMYLLVDASDRGYLCGRVEDVSYEGMYIRTLSSSLSKHCKVDLIFNFLNDVKRAEAIIVRQDDNGIGVIINRQDRANDVLVTQFLPLS